MQLVVIAKPWWVESWNFYFGHLTSHIGCLAEEGSLSVLILCLFIISWFKCYNWGNIPSLCICPKLYLLLLWLFTQFGWEASEALCNLFLILPSWIIWSYSYMVTSLFISNSILFMNYRRWKAQNKFFI